MSDTYVRERDPEAEEKTAGECFRNREGTAPRPAVLSYRRRAMADTIPRFAADGTIWEH